MLEKAMPRSPAPGSPLVNWEDSVVTAPKGSANKM